VNSVVFEIIKGNIFPLPAALNCAILTDNNAGAPGAVLTNNLTRRWSTLLTAAFTRPTPPSACLRSPSTHRPP
jgi:hypothetical protein